MQTEQQSPQSPRVTPLWLVGVVLLAAAGAAFVRVAHAVLHPTLGSLISETVGLLLSWALTLAAAGVAFLLPFWARRQMPTGSREAAQKHALYPASAVLVAVAVSDGFLAASATEIPARALAINYIEFPITFVAIVGCGLYAQRLITGGSIRTLARRLKPPETGALIYPSDLDIPGPSQQAPAIAVLGPSGSGKSHLLASIIASWPGPVFFTTTKPDLALHGAVGKALLSNWIGQDPQQIAGIYDPAGLLHDHWSRCDWDPSQVPTGADPATHRKQQAHVMAEELNSGQGNVFWALRAEPIITSILALGAETGNLPSLVAKLMQADPQQLATLLAQGARRLRQKGDIENADALDGIKGNLLAEATSKRANDEFVTALAALQPLYRIQGNAAANEQLPKLDLGTWARSQGIAGIVVPPEMGKALGPLVAALIQDAISQLRATQGQRHWVALVVLDEAPNVADLPNVPTWATELRGWDAYLILAAQSSEQFRKWDPHNPVAFITHHFPLTLVAQGAAEHDLARLISERHGTHVVRQNVQATNPWYERVPVIPPEEVFGAHRGPGHWVAIYHGQRTRIYKLRSVDDLLKRLALAVQRVEHREELRAKRVALKSAKRLELPKGSRP